MSPRVAIPNVVNPKCSAPSVVVPSVLPGCCEPHCDEPQYDAPQCCEPQQEGKCEQAKLLETKKLPGPFSSTCTPVHVPVAHAFLRNVAIGTRSRLILLLGAVSAILRRVAIGHAV